MSARRRPPRWLRELAQSCRYGAAAQSPARVSALIRDEAKLHGIAPEELARMVARQWKAEGLIASTSLPIERA